MKRFILIFALCSLVSCVKDLSKITLSDQQISCLSEVKKLCRDTESLSISDAVCVSDIYLSSLPGTKVDSRSRVCEVKTLTDTKGVPALYALNYDDGYILVSATKKYFPIIADVEHGSFELENEAGVTVLVDKYLKEIEFLSESAQLESVANAWLKYESGDSIVETKSSINSDYYDALDIYTWRWNQEGLNYYYLRNKPNGLSDQDYDYFCELASQYDMNGYDYMQCSIITEKIYEGELVQYGPLLTTNWGQGLPWNSHVDYGRPLGCVSLAMSQMMYYFNVPIDWNEVPTNVQSYVLYDFLADMRAEIGANENGAAEDTSALRVLNKYNYSSELICHNNPKVTSSIRRRYPVYMAGYHMSDTLNVGHAWVCDGMRTYTDPYKEYTLYVVMKYWDDTIEFVEEASVVYNSVALAPTTYHMNWGWSGTGNGFFLDSDIEVQKSDGSYRDYSYRRTNIIVPLNRDLFGNL